MKAIVQDEYGSADVLRFEHIDQPKIGTDEVLVRVHAAGLDPGVWHLMTGLPYIVRLAGFGLLAPKYKVPGMDLAGRVEAIGASVSEFAVGDVVFGTCFGSFAEYACAKENKLALKPGNISFEQAAAVPVSAYTALHGLRDHGKVQKGQRVLVLGASGGVGHFAVQLAKYFGAEVTGVCSTKKVETVRSLGADHVIDYTREDFSQSGQQYDLILDTAGNRPLSQLRRALTPRGTLTIVGGEGGGRWLGGTDRQMRAMLISPFVGQKLGSFISAERKPDLLFLKGLIEAGNLAPLLDRTYPLSDTPEAIRYWQKGHTRGKVVITV